MNLDEQPREWAVVLSHVRDIHDARAILGAVEYREDRLYANTLPVDAITREFALLTERGLCEVLAAHLTSVGAEAHYTDIYVNGRGEDADGVRMDAIAAACQAQGVTLTYGPSIDSPWTVVYANAPDHVVAALADTHAANNWDYEMEVDLPPLPVAPVPARADELAEAIRRCYAAGVYLRRV